MPTIAAVAADLVLSGALLTLASSLLGLATVLDRDDVCVGRALDRVHAKARPSHAGGVKDSIHLEHYLDLSSRLRAAAWPQRCVFVSANKADFWEARNNPALHHDLAPQLAAAGLEFFGTLEAALGSLRI